MKNTNILTSIGILVYVVLSVIDRFIIKVPDYIYIPIALIIIILMIYGQVKSKKKGIYEYGK